MKGRPSGCPFLICSNSNQHALFVKKLFLRVERYGNHADLSGIPNQVA